MKFFALFLLGSLLLGCSTTRTALQDAEPVSWERVFIYQTPLADEQSAILHIIRDEGLGESGCYLAVAINKQLAARLATGEQATLYVPQGKYEFRVFNDPMGKGLCQFTWYKSFAKPLRIHLQKGDTVLLRLGLIVDPVAFIPLVGFFAEDTLYNLSFYEPEKET